jgi:hypothetical protein
MPKDPPPPKHDAMGRRRDPSSNGGMGHAASVRSIITW